MDRINIGKRQLNTETHKLVWREGNDIGGTAMYDGSALTITYDEPVTTINTSSTVTFSRVYNGGIVETVNVPVLAVCCETQCVVEVPQRPVISITSGWTESGITYFALSADHHIYPNDLTDCSGYTIELSAMDESYKYSDLRYVYLHYGAVAKDAEMTAWLKARIGADWIATTSYYAKPASAYTQYALTFSENEYFKVDDEEDVGISGTTLWDGVSITFSKSYFDIPLTIGEREETGLQHEELVTHEFVDNIIDKSIPPVIDMEKVMFEPYNPQYDSLINQMRFLFHFREREKDSDGNYTEGWSIVEDGNWNNMSGMGIVPNKSDGLRFLNFTADDVYYQKQKIWKSFIRLSFYDSSAVTDQQLLAYSTVFLDTGELYGKYIKAYNDAPEGMYSEEDRVEWAMNSATTEINIYGRSNVEKSSEGFYIYLFPTELDENGEGRIYMKVEFNHAGYGRTIPFLMPKFAGNSQYVMPISVSEFFKQEFIPIDIKYHDRLRKYVYSIPESVLNYYGIAYEAIDVLKFNLVETKLSS